MIATHHRQQECLRVLSRESLVLELFAINGLSTHSVASDEVITLDHETANEEHICWKLRVVMEIIEGGGE